MKVAPFALALSFATMAVDATRPTLSENMMKRGAPQEARIQSSNKVSVQVRQCALSYHCGQCMSDCANGGESHGQCKWICECECNQNTKKSCSPTGAPSTSPTRSPSRKPTTAPSTSPTKSPTRYGKATTQSPTNSPVAPEWNRNLKKRSRSVRCNRKSKAARTELMGTDLH